MTEHEDNRVHFLLDHLNVTGQVTLNEEDMSLILRHQRELGIEEGKGCLEQIRWERDIAISQLEDIGASFGLKMSLWLDEHDKEVIRKFAEWLANGNTFIRRIGTDKLTTIDEALAEYEKEQKGEQT